MPNFYGTPSSPVSSFKTSQSLNNHQPQQLAPLTINHSSNMTASSYMMMGPPPKSNTGNSRVFDSAASLPQHHQPSVSLSSASSSYRVQAHPTPSLVSSSSSSLMDHERSDRYRNSKSLNNMPRQQHEQFATTTSNSNIHTDKTQKHAQHHQGVGNSLNGKSKSAGRVSDTKQGSLILSNSSSNNSNTNSDTSVLVHENEKFGDEFQDCEEGFLYLHPSWPVYVYTEKGEVFMRVLCIKVNTKEVIVFDPFSKRVFQQGCFVDIKKISFDTNEEQNFNTNFRLFRIQFNKMDTLIFLSRDRNEIINCLLYYAKEFRERDDEEINIEKNPNAITFAPDISISLHHFQVFGIDKRGRYFPHILSLYSNHVRHVDSETKQSFSTHGYSDIEGDIEIDPDMPTRLTIRYRDDNAYSFLVSDKDRSEVLVLLQGRSFIYRPCSEVQIFEGVELNTSLGESNPISDFPQKLARNVTEVGVILTVPEPIKNQSGFYEKADVDTNEITERNKTNLELLQKGVKLFMHVPKKLALRGKKTAAKPRFVRMFFDKFLNKVVVQWGKSSDKLNHRAFVESIEEGKSTIIESSKISPYQISNFSFVIYVDCKEKSATLGGRLFLVANGSVEYQQFIEGSTLLIEQQQKTQRSLKN